MKSRRTPSPAANHSRRDQDFTRLTILRWLEAAWQVRSVRLAILFVVAPALTYLVGFYIFNPAYLGHFTTHFFLDSGDGLQNVWNIWWVDKSVTQLGHQPWWTGYLEWPFGVSLIPHTLNAFNGLMAIPLLHLFHFSLVQAVNFVVLFAFVMSGLTMFWLVFYLMRSYTAALVAGLFFTFSSYHFAHAIGHMQLISMEWIPLFLLAWWRLLDRPSVLIAMGAAGSLTILMLCDYYYLLYAVIAAVIIALYRVIARQVRLSWRLAASVVLFGCICLVTIGPFALRLNELNSPSDPLLGAHPALDFGLDLFAPFIPGGEWYWNGLTQRFWQRLPGYFAETSVFLGVSMPALLLIAIVRHKKLRLPEWLNVWWIIMAVFWLLALGPRLRVFGKVPFPNFSMPYEWVGSVVKVLAISGMPIRMMVMVVLAGAVIAAAVVRRIDLRTARGKWLLALLLVAFFFDVRPMPLPLTSPIQPAYVQVLKSLPGGAQDGVINDAAISTTTALLAQTTFDKPIVFGYVSRLPTSLDHKNFHIFADLEQGRQARLCSVYHIRYLATPKYYHDGFPIIYQDPKGPIHIYDLKNGSGC